MSQPPRRLRKGSLPPRRARLLSGLGWGITLLGFIGWIVNEVSVDLVPVHYAMYGVMFAGAYLGLRFLR